MPPNRSCVIASTAIKSMLDDRGTDSRKMRLLALPDFRERLQTLSRDELEKLKYDWRFWGRANQQLSLSRSWSTWYLRMGRGAGKTRTGAEAVRRAVEEYGARQICLCARTQNDTISVMVEGQRSGLLTICPPWNKPVYHRTKKKLVWPNGAMASLYSADEPDQLKGPEHDFAWLDEPAAWRQLKRVHADIKLGLRLAGAGPCRMVMTTTPKLSVKYLKQIANEPSTLLTTGSSYDNLENLNENFKKELLKFKDTSKEQEEIFGLDIEAREGALWIPDIIERNRISSIDGFRWENVVCGVDSTTSDSKDTDDCGIVFAGKVLSGIGRDGRSIRGHTVILDDFTIKGRPDLWAREIVRGCLLHGVREIVAERNAGGLLIEQTIRLAFIESDVSDRLPRVELITSHEDKATRAEPTSALYEANWVHHFGNLIELEEEQCTWVPKETPKSPGRIDASVFCVNYLNPNQSRGAGALRAVKTTR